MQKYTFSRILLSKSYIFSRITPCTLYWIQKVHPQKTFIHPSNIQQKSLSLLTTKSAKRTSYEGSKTGTLDTSKARKSSKSNRNSIIQNYTGEELFHLKSGYYNHKRLRKQHDYKSINWYNHSSLSFCCQKVIRNICQESYRNELRSVKDKCGTS